ncbi:TetR/AcrR family transcriptional regulator [Allonocardiopsis opalescens]|uniref:TetR family transcriptional regulator n=1 Tax=Allonocardiopsis opalescens TaxID=1144618 RepID=A0A2T0PU21_9ACTN|nr:TetR/AcrR family transcriptional regulator [Allonocardiopsis opalescens]PRX92400.1 TetR family transcriptional regulator [Allonocardiopsis opalescens]
MTTDMSAQDPTRALELLWGNAPRPSRGPRQGLELAGIVRAAIEIADAEGLAALSMRRVAARLGVGTTTLYTYVPGKTELLALMLDAVAADAALPHTVPGDWRAKFTAWAHEDWIGFRRSPWALQVAAVRPLPGPNLMAWYDSALRVLDDTDLDGREKVMVIETVDAYVRGVARTAGDIAEAERRDSIQAAEWFTAQVDFLGRRVDFRRFPHVARSGLVHGLPDADDVFAFGLERMLDGIEAFIRSRSDAD